MKKNTLIFIIAILLVVIMVVSFSSTLMTSLKDVLEPEEETKVSETVENNPIVDNGDNSIDIYFTYQHIWYEDGEKLSRMLVRDMKTYNKGETYEYKVKDYFESGYIAKCGDVITGTALQDRSVIIEVYEVYNYAALMISSGVAIAEISAQKFLSIGENNECLAILNDTGKDIQSFAIDVVDYDGFTQIGRYVVTDFSVPDGDYLILFPHTGQFIGYQTNDNTRKMLHDSEFVTFYLECYTKY